MKRRLIYIIILLMMVVGGVYYHTSTIRNIESNYKEALFDQSDSIEKLILTNNHNLFVIKSFKMEMESYKDSISIIQKALDKANKGKIERIVDIKTITQLDTIYIPLSQEFPFKSESSYFSMAGAIESDSLIINELSIPSNLNVGYTESGFVFATSDNPYIHIKSISSNIKPPPKEKAFNSYHSLSIGVGLNYGLIHKELDFGPSITYGFIFEF